MNNPGSFFLEYFKNKITKGSPLWVSQRYIRNLFYFNSPHPTSIYLYKVHGNIALHTKKTLYFPIPKTACSSLKKVCADILEINVIDDNIKEKIHYMRFPYVKRNDILDLYNDYFRFCFFRNPWDRLVSCYMNKIVTDGTKNYTSGFTKRKINKNKFKTGMEFDDFIRVIGMTPDSEADAHYISQHTYITANNGELLTNYIAKFEEFGKEFSYICDKMGIDNEELPHLMKSSHDDYRKYYSDETEEIVRKRYQKDLSILHYDF